MASSGDQAAGIPRPVWLLAWTSLFTDAATETIYPLLPIYLSRVLGGSPVALGVIEGAAEAVNSLLKVVSGRWSDRRVRRRPIVIAGYAISSIARPFVALTMTWPQVLLVRVLDRTGKGIRGAPRDALLARFTTSANRGRLFGFHEAMDHVGAVVGPVFAAVFLVLFPNAYRTLFALTVIPGAIAVTLLFFVDEDAPKPLASTSREAAVLNQSARLPPRLVAVMGAFLVFSLGNSTDAFLLLRLSGTVGIAYVPLLWAAIHVVKASLSTWGGGLSDRVGRKRAIVGGWLVYAMVYLGFATSTRASAFVGWFLLYGLYFALAEGPAKALVTDLAPSGRWGTAFGFYNATLGLGAMAASVLFGYLYEEFGASTAFGTGAALACAAAVMLAFVPTDGPRRVE